MKILLGVLVVAVLGLAGALVCCLPRYEAVHGFITLGGRNVACMVKLDRWTGRAWVYGDPLVLHDGAMWVNIAP